MDKDLLIQVFVPTRDGGGIGTGYPIGRHRILTARHVVCRDDRDESRPIEVRWYHQSEPAGAWRPATVVWDSGPELDAALLDCQFPDGLADRWRLAISIAPQDEMGWSSEGFAKAGAQGTARPPIPLKGRCYSAGRMSRGFHLGVDDATSLTDGWKGVSGAPVIVAQAVIGVIIERPENFEERRLLATPMWRLLEIDAFRTEIGHSQREARLAAVKERLIKDLQVSETATRKLASTLGRPQPRSPGDHQALAEALLGQRVQEAITGLKRCHADFVEDDEGAAARAIRRITQRLIPAICDHGTLEDLTARDRNPGTTVVAVLAATQTVAEVIMAGIDRRPTRYKPVAASTGEVGWLEGDLLIPDPPAGGFDAPGEQWISDFSQHLLDTYAERFDAKVREAKSPEKLLNHLSRMMAVDAKNGQTSYYVFMMPDDAAIRTEADQMFRVLAERIPGIAFIQLSDDDDMLDYETEVYYGARELFLPDATDTP